jgi:hypothetical protein
MVNIFGFCYAIFKYRTNQQPVLDDIPEEDDLLGISDIVLDDFL